MTIPYEDRRRTLIEPTVAAGVDGSHSPRELTTLRRCIGGRMSGSPTPDRLAMSVAEAAQSLGVSRPWLYGFINDGTLRSVLIGRRRLVTRADLARFIEEHRA